MSATDTSYDIKGLIARYFAGPISDTDNNFRTVPILLRAVADYMDEHDIQDPEFSDLKVSLIWEREDNAKITERDPFYYAATLYYLKEPK